ncbi:hypothetical protein G6F56_007229 [Rhizopus delemar]|nr:hypothetical protein G6F56_007229 [Rhizopus delemar]
MKQKHGKFKGFQKRFFVLYDEELRYYKTQNDSTALAIISLDHYTLTHVQTENQTTENKQFCLLSDDESKYDWPDYFLQAESEQDWKIWVDCLTQLTTESTTSVLDKWLERLDMPNKSVRDSFYSESNNSVPTLSPPRNEEDERSSIASSTLSPSEGRRSIIRNHKSAESFGLLKSMTSFERRPSDVSKRPFPYRLFSWSSRPKSSSSSIISMPQDEPIHTAKAFESPIIHPSDYNQDSH